MYSTIQGINAKKEDKQLFYISIYLLCFLISWCYYTLKYYYIIENKYSNLSKSYLNYGIYRKIKTLTRLALSR